MHLFEPHKIRYYTIRNVMVCSCYISPIVEYTHNVYSYRMNIIALACFKMVLLMMDTFLYTTIKKNE